jgi:Ni,Fe-hydrogenase I large subunit
MGTKITIDPITRIEGHLKAEVVVDDITGKVTDAKVSGTMARGIEKLLLGKDPRDATYVTERICGVCFGAHGWTSCLAVETAHGTTAVPEAARLLRNLIVGACWLHDHPLHFYHLSALDYLDLRALADYDGNDSYILKIKDLAIAELTAPPVEGEYAGPLLPHYSYDSGGYWINDLDTVAMAVQHYLDALVMQVKAKRMSALLAGKQPHQSGIIVGGVTQFPSRSTRDEFRFMLSQQTDFIKNVYVNDVVTLGTGPLLGLAISDVGVGHQNYLSYGGFPEADGSFLYPEGAIVNGSLDASDRSAIEAALTEDVTSSWYTSAGGGHPSGTTQIFDLEKADAHSFVKAPRYKGNPMEVGPLARMMVAIARGVNHPAVETLNDLIGAGVKPGAVARHAARALETLMLCDRMVAWLDELAALGGKMSGAPIHDTAHWEPPATSTGWGMTEAPRGALAHWVGIDNYLIDHYACVVPTTWNASPTDGNNKRGPYEEALIGCPVPDTDNPINVVRIIRSFDPCIACAVHVITPGGDMKKFMLDI